MGYINFKRKIRKITSNKDLKAIGRDISKVFKPTIDREIRRAKKSGRSTNLFQEIDF